MKHHPTLPTKREPVRKGVIKRFHAITKNRKQRVAATAGMAAFDGDIPGRKIGMALAVIVGVHVIAAGLVFFHHWRLEGRGGDAVVTKAAAVMPVAGPAEDNKLGAGDVPYLVGSGDTYASIAQKNEVDEQALRDINRHRLIQSGAVLKLPPKKIVAMEPADVSEIRANAPASDRGIVEVPKATVVLDEPRLVKPKLSKASAESFRAVEQAPKQPSVVKATPAKPAPNPAAAKTVSAPKASGRSYTVQNGDNPYRIAARFKVDPARLMKANGISDAKKLKTGMTLVIPN